MITQVSFQNFKALKNASLKLGAFNVIIGPNGSGKSSVLQALQAFGNSTSINWAQAASAGIPLSSVSISLDTQIQNRVKTILIEFSQGGLSFSPANQLGKASNFWAQEDLHIRPFLDGIKTFSFQTTLMSQPVDPTRWGPLEQNGSNLAGAITYLRDQDEESYNQLRSDLQHWIPEYDNLGFENDQRGFRKLTFRQKSSRQAIPASQVSEGTLMSLALLTLVHQTNSPTLIGLEEPDHGLHPRLLRELRDALYRLSFPGDFGINRPPVQVVVTTHSPYFLDLFRDHPEQIIVAEKNADGTATFKNLSDDAGLREIIGDAPLSEVWYSGILGGVPAAA